MNVMVVTVRMRGTALFWHYESEEAKTFFVLILRP